MQRFGLDRIASAINAYLKYPKPVVWDMSSYRYRWWFRITKLGCIARLGAAYLLLRHSRTRFEKLFVYYLIVIYTTYLGIVMMCDHCNSDANLNMSQLPVQVMNGFIYIELALSAYIIYRRVFYGDVTERVVDLALLHLRLQL